MQDPSQPCPRTAPQAKRIQLVAIDLDRRHLTKTEQLGEQVMVKVNAGPAGASQASGVLGSGVYSHNRFGMYIRNHTVPVNPQSSRQQVVRAALSQLTDRWSQVLTAAQRTAWNLYAESTTVLDKFGAPIHLTGFNHYLRSNIPLVQQVQAPVDAGPTIFEVPEADPVFSVSISEATQIATCVYDDTLAWDNETGGFLILFMGSPQNPQRNFFAGPWRTMGVVPGVTGAPVASPVLATCTFAATQTQRVWCYARIARADGRISSPFRADCVVGA